MLAIPADRPSDCPGGNTRGDIRMLLLFDRRQYIMAIHFELLCDGSDACDDTTREGVSHMTVTIVTIVITACTLQHLVFRTIIT